MIRPANCCIRGHVFFGIISQLKIAVHNFAHIRRQFRSLYQDADGTMQCFVWHKDQKAVCHCLAAMLNLADDSKQNASS